MTHEQIFNKTFTVYYNFYFFFNLKAKYVLYLIKVTAYLRSKLSGTFASFDCFCSLKCCAIATALSWKLDAEHLPNVMTVCVCVSVTKAKGERSKKPFLERVSVMQ